MLDLARLDEAVRHEGGVSRRLFLSFAASLSSLPLLGRQTSGAARAVSFPKNPFSVGVATGDPTPTGVVLWTRLAPEPLHGDGGMSPEDVEVAWEVASDDSMRRIVQRGTQVASSKLAHSVHVEVDGLEPNRWYWYRFRVGDAESPIARTRTMPARESLPDEIRFAFASCQHYESGLYTAYEHMAQEDLDLVFHLGDYIYEGAVGDSDIRRHTGNRCRTLKDYRIRHSLYKTDPHLQAMHARCPWLVTWDDHELDNNCAGAICQDTNVDPAKFLKRRAAAYQAYYEMMPLRATSLPKGPDMQLFRSASFGRLAEFLVLDTRQYRSDQPNNDKPSRLNDDAFSSERTMVGPRQMEWLKTTLTESPAAWNVLAQQVMMGMVDREPGDRERFPMDTWTGYCYERARLLKFVDERKIANPVVLTGDIHCNWVNDLHVDDRKADTPIVATEFVGTSISSSGDGEDRPAYLDALLAENPAVRFHNRQRGYVRCTVTPQTWTADYRTVEYVSRPGAPINTRASFVVENGIPGAKPA